ncbi:MAG: hypothetical protein MUC43_11075 [Pirellula sp.]|nr:hypothetical protein [Pirellula sp.]
MPVRIVFDLKQSSGEKLTSDRLAAFAPPDSDSTFDGYEILMTGCSSQDFIAAGVRASGTLHMDGSVGDFCLMSYGLGDAVVEGHAGDFLGHSVHSGSIVVKQNVGNCLGAMGSGGLIAVQGNAGDRAGIALQGADILIRGNAGGLLGMGMVDGNIVVGGTVGPEMGKGMIGGSIFVRGEPTSLSPHIEEFRMREPDKLKIGLLMLKAGIKSTGKEFRLFRPVS